MTDKERYELCQLIISKFLGSTKKINWGREMVYAKKLVEKYPNFDFWRKLPVPAGLKSLFFFSKQQGKRILSQAALPKTILQQNIDYNLSSEKLCEEITFEKKPKTLMEFLKYVKEI